jgi:hypothetical protein
MTNRRIILRAAVLFVTFTALGFLVVIMARGAA